jgi:hypothetical protein
MPSDDLSDEILCRNRILAERSFEGFGIALPEIRLTLDGSPLGARCAWTAKANLESFEYRFMAGAKVSQEAEQPMLFILSGESFGQIGGIIDRTAERLRQEVRPSEKRVSELWRHGKPPN